MKKDELHQKLELIDMWMQKFPGDSTDEQKATHKEKFTTFNTLSDTGEVDEAWDSYVESFNLEQIRIALAPPKPEPGSLGPVADNSSTGANAGTSGAELTGGGGTPTDTPTTDTPSEGDPLADAEAQQPDAAATPPAMPTEPPTSMPPFGGGGTPTDTPTTDTPSEGDPLADAEAQQPDAAATPPAMPTEPPTSMPPFGGGEPQSMSEADKMEHDRLMNKVDDLESQRKEIEKEKPGFFQKIVDAIKGVFGGETSEDEKKDKIKEIDEQIDKAEAKINQKKTSSAPVMPEFPSQQGAMPTGDAQAAGPEAAAQDPNATPQGGGFTP